MGPCQKDTKSGVLGRRTILASRSRKLILTPIPSLADCIGHPLDFSRVCLSSFGHVCGRSWFPPPYRRGSLIKMALPSRFSHFPQRIFRPSRRTLCLFPKRAVSDRRSTRAMWPQRRHLQSTSHHSGRFAKVISSGAPAGAASPAGSFERRAALPMACHI